MSATPPAADPSAEITVYTLPWCPHCARARALLKRRGLAFRELDGTETPDFRARLADLTGGFTVPQIVIDGTPIGGAPPPGCSRVGPAPGSGDVATSRRSDAFR